MRPACRWLIRVGRFQRFSALSRLAFELSGRENHWQEFHEPRQESDGATVDRGQSDGRRATRPATTHLRRGSRDARHRPHFALHAGLGQGSRRCGSAGRCASAVLSSRCSSRPSRAGLLKPLEGSATALSRALSVATERVPARAFGVTRRLSRAFQAATAAAAPSRVTRSRRSERVWGTELTRRRGAVPGTMRSQWAFRTC